MPPPHEQIIALKHESRELQLDSPASQDFSLELDGGYETRSDDGMVSLDPDVLASLVIQLRTNLSSAQSEREELITALAIAQTHIADLSHQKERAERLEVELAESCRKNQESEDVISILRGKVEESRQGLMRLQAESRRISQLSGSVPYAPSPHAMSTSFDSTRNRQSLQIATATTLLSLPPKGRNNRRESQLSDSATSNESENDTPHQQQQDQASIRQSRRQSSMYVRPTESLLNPMAGEMDSLRKELIAVRLELMQTRNELMETKEAREASDVCCKALKEFINEHTLGEGSPDPNLPSIQGLRLPPLPTDYIPDTEDDVERTPVAQAGKKSWGLGGLWSTAAAAQPPSSFSQHLAKLKAPVQMPGALPNQISNFVSSWRATSTQSQSENPAPASTSTFSPVNLHQRFRSASAIDEVNDNYTPAPQSGSFKRKYGTVSGDYSDVARPYDISVRNANRYSKRSSIGLSANGGASRSSPSSYTPSLTDGETAVTGSEPGSPPVRRSSIGGGIGSAKRESVQSSLESLREDPGIQEAEDRLNGRIRPVIPA